MVILRGRRRGKSGMFMIDGMVALAILIVAALPLSVWMLADGRTLRDTYQRAVVLELVDGEMEILAAGGWRDYAEGAHAVTWRGNASANLPQGRLQLIRKGGHLRLEWEAAGKSGIGRVTREITVK